MSLACLSGLLCGGEGSIAVPTSAFSAQAGTGHTMSAPLRQRPATPSRTVSAALEPFFIRLQYLRVSQGTGMSTVAASSHDGDNHVVMRESTCRNREGDDLYVKQQPDFRLRAQGGFCPSLISKSFDCEPVQVVGVLTGGWPGSGAAPSAAGRAAPPPAALHCQGRQKPSR